MPTPGYPKMQEIPGRWRGFRHVTITADGWTLVELRNSTRFGSCPWLSEDQQALAESGGVLKALYVTMQSDTGTLKIAESESPGVNYVSCDASTGLALQWPKEAGVHQLWIDTGNEALTFEVEFWFDLETE